MLSSAAQTPRRPIQAATAVGSALSPFGRVDAEVGPCSRASKGQAPSCRHRTRELPDASTGLPERSEPRTAWIRKSLENPPCKDGPSRMIFGDAGEVAAAASGRGRFGAQSGGGPARSTPMRQDPARSALDGGAARGHTLRAGMCTSPSLEVRVDPIGAAGSDAMSRAASGGRRTWPRVGRAANARSGEGWARCARPGRGRGGDLRL